MSSWWTNPYQGGLRPTPIAGGPSRPSPQPATQPPASRRPTRKLQFIPPKGNNGNYTAAEAQAARKRYDDFMAAGRNALAKPPAAPKPPVAQQPSTTTGPIASQPLPRPTSPGAGEFPSQPGTAQPTQQPGHGTPYNPSSQPPDFEGSLPGPRPDYSWGMNPTPQRPDPQPRFDFYPDPVQQSLNNSMGLFGGGYNPGFQPFTQTIQSPFGTNQTDMWNNMGGFVQAVNNQSGQKPVGTYLGEGNPGPGYGKQNYDIRSLINQGNQMVQGGWQNPFMQPPGYMPNPNVGSGPPWARAY